MFSAIVQGITISVREIDARREWIYVKISGGSYVFSLEPPRTFLTAENVSIIFFLNQGIQLGIQGRWSKEKGDAKR